MSFPSEDSSSSTSFQSLFMSKFFDMALKSIYLLSYFLVLTHFLHIGCSHLHVRLSPADPTLNGSEEILAKDTSVSNEVLLGHVETGTPKTAWGVKAMSNTIRCLMIDLTHRHVYPSASFCGPISAKHWSGSELLRFVVLPVTGPI